ncbi:hypothetical protein BKA70DRAFT_1216692 [Coprinopsis sp. MPI-PUGE-AT-0042]|nr:hypothetical protein BKA70DRAFT_1216692 [Coprinopsis sp. MPI-PUGE-AT-0042]
MAQTGLWGEGPMTVMSAPRDLVVFVQGRCSCRASIWGRSDEKEDITKRTIARPLKESPECNACDNPDNRIEPVMGTEMGRESHNVLKGDRRTRGFGAFRGREDSNALEDLTNKQVVAMPGGIVDEVPGTEAVLMKEEEARAVAATGFLRERGDDGSVDFDERVPWDFGEHIPRARERVGSDPCAQTRGGGGSPTDSKIQSSDSTPLGAEGPVQDVLCMDKERGELLRERNGREMFVRKAQFPARDWISRIDFDVKGVKDIHETTDGEVNLNVAATALVMGADNALVVRLGHDDAVVVTCRLNMENEELDGETLQPADVAIGTSPPFTYRPHIPPVAPDNANAPFGGGIDTDTEVERFSQRSKGAGQVGMREDILPPANIGFNRRRGSEHLARGVVVEARDEGGERWEVRAAEPNDKCDMAQHTVKLEKTFFVDWRTTFH